MLMAMKGASRLEIDDLVGVIQAPPKELGNKCDLRAETHGRGAFPLDFFDVHELAVQQHLKRHPVWIETVHLLGKFALSIFPSPLATLE